MALRLIPVTAALIVSAWFGLGWVQARDTGQADALLSSTSSPSAAQAGRIRSLLSSAATLNPDRTVDLLRARLDLNRRDYAPAIALLEAVTRSEPENVFAWSQLGYTAGTAGRLQLAARAAHHVAVLDPGPGRGR
jgi:Flp pilus assembly protein TadD